MPQVPYTGAPEVAPNYPATPGVRGTASPAAFGAEQAAAGQRLGATLERAGDELFARAYAMQQVDQQADAINAHAAAADRIGQRVLEFRTLSGKSAKDAYDSFVKGIDTILEEEGKNLGSDYAKKLYLSESRQLRTRTVESAGSHAGNEFKHYLLGTEQSRVNNAIAGSTLHPEDDEAFKASLKTVDSSAAMMRSLEGWSDEQELDFKNKSRSKLVYDRATELARTSPVAAQKVLDDAVKEGLVSGEAAGKASQFIRQQRLTTMTRVETANLLAGQGEHFGKEKVPVDRLYDAIIGVESGGNQRAVTAVTHKDGTKDRALGLGQVLESNLAPWLEEAGMPAMSPEQYLNDREAQIKLIKFKLSEYQEKYGSANEAGRHWRGLAFRDSTNGETEPQYLARLNARLAKNAGISDVEAVATAKAKELVPDDEEFHATFRDQAVARTSVDRRVQREQEFTDRNTVEAALGPAPDGKLPTSVDELPEEVRAAWNNLPEHLQTRYNKVFARNAKEDYAPNAANQAEYRAWVGRLTDGMASEEDRKAAMDADFISMKLPMAQRQQLIGMQKKAFKSAAHNPKLEHAMSVLQTQLFNADVTRKSDEEGYFQFRGALHEILQQKLEEGKYPDDKEIKEIGAGLLRQTVISKGWLWDTKGEAFRVEVPEDSAEKIKSMFLDSKGREPTDAELQQIYAVHQFNQFYTKKPKAQTSGVVGLRAVK